MPHLRPHLAFGLRNWEEYQVCSVAVGVVGDICRAIGDKILPYCDEIVTLLLGNLQVRCDRTDLCICRGSRIAMLIFFFCFV